MMADSLENMTEEQRQALAFRKLMNHPDVGLDAKRLYKKAVPDARFPELEMDERVTAATKPLTEKIAALEQAQLEERVRQNREVNHRKVTEAGFSVEQVEKTMTDEKIVSYDTAIKYLQGQSALAPPTPQNLTPIRMPDNLKDIQKNPNAWARNEAYQAINEIKAGRVAGNR